MMSFDRWRKAIVPPSGLCGGGIRARSMSVLTKGNTSPKLGKKLPLNRVAEPA
jgi:hypothetical protein